MDGKQKYGKMQEHDVQRRKWDKVGEQRRKYYKNAGNESKSMGKCRIDNTGNGIKAMESENAGHVMGGRGNERKMQESRKLR